MWPRVAAGTFAGFMAAAGVLVVVTFAWPGRWQSTIVPGLLAFFPLWIAAFFIAWSARSATRAWGWLLIVAAAGFGLAALLRNTGLIR